MRISVTVEGVQETIHAMEALKEGIPDEVQVGMAAGIQPIIGAMKAYPPQPGFVGAPTTRRIVPYVRTGNYGARISGPSFTRSGPSEIVATINSPAPYSTYLRGDLDGYAGAWMHLGIWEPLTAILDRLLPQASARIEAQISRLIQRLGLGD